MLQPIFTKNQNQPLHNTATKPPQLLFRKIKTKFFANYCDKTAAAIIHKESKPNFCKILRQKRMHLVFTKNQNQHMHNTAINLPRLLFTKNQNQIFAKYYYNTAAGNIHKESKSTFEHYCDKPAACSIQKNQNQMFTQYCDKTAACSIPKESKPTFYTILRRNCCM